MTVYFITVEGQSVVKIGTTEVHPAARLSMLQTGCPQKLILLGSCPGTSRDEHAAHRALAKYKIRGEWFDYSELRVREFVTLSLKFGLALTLRALSDVLRVERQQADHIELIDAMERVAGRCLSRKHHSPLKPRPAEVIDLAARRRKVTAARILASASSDFRALLTSVACRLVARQPAGQPIRISRETVI